METKKREPNEIKKKEVAVLKEIISRYKTVGLLDLSNLPSPQLQIMRKKIEGNIRVTKKRLLRIVLKELNKGMENLEESLTGIMPGLILTNESSFKLAKFLRKNKDLIAAKAGQIAPKDLVVNAGPTSLPPGPIIGELGAAGIKASVEGGKVTVREDSIVAKEGEIINDKKANILGKLGVKPIEIGLNLVAAFEDGNLFKKDVLDVDEKVYINKLKEIANNAVNLSVKIGYVTKDNIKILLKKVQIEILGLDKVVNAGRDKLKKELATADMEAEKILEKISSKQLSLEEGSKSLLT